jgi:hypothetical protein
MALAIIGVLVGIALGPRFNVLVLVPAIPLAVIFALMVGLARGDRFGSIVLAMVIVGSAVQLGYWVGVFLPKHVKQPA